jgi:hypothetical protein
MKRDKFSTLSDFEDALRPEAVPRPLGVSLVTLWTGLFAGLFPLVALGFLLATADVALTGWQIASAALLGVGIIVSSVRTWRGISSARYALVVLVILHYGMVAWQNYQLGGGGAVDYGTLRAVSRATTGVVIALYLLFSRKANAFFYQDPYH